MSLDLAVWTGIQGPPGQAFPWVAVLPPNEFRLILCLSLSGDSQRLLQLVVSKAMEPLPTERCPSTMLRHLGAGQPYEVWGRGEGWVWGAVLIPSPLRPVLPALHPRNKGSGRR